MVYSPGMKEAFAWWSREFLEGMKAEMRIPQDWSTVRTILIFATAATGDRPKAGDNLYFEIPAGIEQIESLKTETHLFLFDTLQKTPWQALEGALAANARYTCMTLGAENKQGNREVAAQWRIDGSPTPVLIRVPQGTYRPTPPAGMQQVRAEVRSNTVAPFDYKFEREANAWEPELAPDGKLHLPSDGVLEAVRTEARGGYSVIHEWSLVKGLVPRSGAARESDQVALELASPDSGSFILVSLRRRLRDGGNKF